MERAEEGKRILEEERESEGEEKRMGMGMGRIVGFGLSPSENRRHLTHPSTSNGAAARLRAS
jgi:hypothetical protein